MTPDIEFERGLPASVDAERSILGGILLSDELIDEARGALGEHDFALDSHRRLFRVMSELRDKEKAIDIITLYDELSKRNWIESIGGIAYIASLTEGMPRRISIGDYIHIVKEKSALRQLINLCSGAITEAADQGVEPTSIIGKIQDGMQDILNDDETDDPLVQSYTIPILDEFERARHTQEEEMCLSYGLYNLNQATDGGMRHGEVTVVGARSGVGKSTLMMQAARDNCEKGIPVHLFSLEMTRKQILHRLWSMVSGVPYKKIRRPKLSLPDDARRVRDAASIVAEWPLRIHDKSELHISKIVALARLSIRRHGSQLIIVDYAQNVEADGKDERTKVSSVSSKLTAMIKHEKAHLMLLSQLRKVPREMYSHPPHVGDLRETGQLENDAHVVILLHRGWDEQNQCISHIGMAIIPKQRNGETGVVDFKFNPVTVEFEPYQSQPYAEAA
jgi:replicative DNA helicase